MSSIKQIEQAQLQQQIDALNAALSQTETPPAGGWIRRMRKALGMSGAALSKRLGGSRTQAANLERYERDDGISLRSLREVAEAMGCRLVYAIVPPPGSTVEQLMSEQARRRARQQIAAAATHMALEQQSLSAANQQAEIERISRQLLQKLPRDFWDPESPSQ
ncbi:MAG: mobile mystery protein A [Xanthomonadales bacterium]|nr:mobile mystery protein A [Xanthomonadales bacterium]